MTRKHASIIALILALAAIAGGVAAMRTANVGATAKSPSLNAQIAQRTAQLNRAEASLRKALQQSQAQPVSTTPAAPPQRIVYVRPAPHIVTIHRRGSSSEGGGYDD